MLQAPARCYDATQSKPCYGLQSIVDDTEKMSADFSRRNHAREGEAPAEPKNGSEWRIAISDWFSGRQCSRTAENFGA